MDYAETVGYVASGLVLGAFMMRTMIPLRLVGIASNIAFITYGAVTGLPPVVVLHAILLPLNIWRLAEMLRLTREIANAEADGNLAWLMPFMHGVSRPAGTVLFRKGDDADVMYVITSGRVRIDELDVEVGPGDVLGEIGVFGPGGKRMASATCLDDCRLQTVTRTKVRELVYQHPHLGFYMIGVVTHRLLDDLRSLEQRRAEA